MKLKGVLNIRDKGDYEWRITIPGRALIIANETKEEYHWAEDDAYDFARDANIELERQP